MENVRITMRDGIRIYTEYCINDKEKPTVMYLHGGPGQGCWDFQYAAGKLSETHNVIQFDQRGVLRSDPIREPFSSQQLITDMEDIRIAFGIEKLILCGHSYGGQLILRYAMQYPQYVERLLFVCPSFWFLDSMRNVYNLCRKYYAERDAYAALEQMNVQVSADCEDVYLSYMPRISDAILEKVYYGKPIPPHVKADIYANTAKAEDWSKSSGHFQCVFAEKEIFRNYLPLLKQVTIPALLIVGDHDPICSELQQKVFMENTNHEKTVICEAGHSLHVENADEFIAIVKRYLLPYQNFT